MKNITTEDLKESQMKKISLYCFIKNQKENKKKKEKKENTVCW